MHRFNAEVVKQFKISAAESAAAAEKVKKEQASALQKSLCVRGRHLAPKDSGGTRLWRIPRKRPRLVMPVNAPSSLVSLDLARAIPSSFPTLFRKKLVRRESFLLCSATPHRVAHLRFN